MSSMSLQDKIKHYQRNIVKHRYDEDRVIHCLKRLKQLPISVKDLQSTHVGRTVNALRKFDGIPGTMARALVNDWMQMVRDRGQLDEDREDEVDFPEDSESQIDKKSSDHSDSVEKRVKTSCSESNVANGITESQENNEEAKSHSILSENKKSKETKECRHDNTISKDKLHSKEKRSSPKKRKLEECSEGDSVKKCKIDTEKCKISDEKGKKSKHRDESSKKSDKHKDVSSKEKKSHYRSKNESSSSSSKSETRSTSVTEASSKKEKSDKKGDKDGSKKAKVDINQDGGIDCNSGTSFGEALGMCSKPLSSRKRYSTQSKTSKLEVSSPPMPSTSSCQKEVNKAIKTETESPSLLLPNAKLEPLNVNLAVTLPVISPNYRPLPNIAPSYNERRQAEERMLHEVMTVKNQRTKVYSGNKSGYTSVPTLFDACIRVLIEHIESIDYTGGIPYYILKPVLQRATPEQLFNIEHYNPYLVEETDELWEQHCRKTFFKECQNRDSNEPWREVYMRCIEERELKLKGLTEGIKRKMIEKAQPVRVTKLAFVDNIVKPPRNVLRSQAKYGTGKEAISKSENKKKLLLESATSSTNISVPMPVRQKTSASSTSTAKKTKAPLMAKALQLIKGRYKR